MSVKCAALKSKLFGLNHKLVTYHTNKLTLGNHFQSWMSLLVIATRWNLNLFQNAKGCQ